MKRLIYFSFLGLLANCSTKNKKATLSVGNKAAYTVAGEMQVAGSKKLTKTDTLYFLLSTEKPLGVPVVTFKVFKVRNEQKQVMAAVDIKTDPNVKSMRSRYVVKELIANYGYGNFIAQFLSDEDLIAQNTFSFAEQ